MQASGHTLETGATLGRFEIVGPIGSGGMGTVYRATDPQLGRTVAIKVLHDDNGDAVARARLVREAQAMARLAHPNVVPVHEIGSGDPCFIVMELVVGTTVRAWLAETPREVAEIVEVFRQAGEGLAAAHAADLVHRDFKPENILRGADGRVRVVDFGLVARGEDRVAIPETAALDVALTHTGIALGTPAYMAPEQHRGEPVDARSDQFSFAVALYEALYGERPFAGATYREMVRNVKSGTVRAPREDALVPDAIRAALLRSLAVDPAGRYPSINALLAALVTGTAPTRSETMPAPATTAAPATRTMTRATGIAPAVANVPADVVDSTLPAIAQRARLPIAFVVTAVVAGIVIAVVAWPSRSSPTDETSPVTPSSIAPSQVTRPVTPPITPPERPTSDTQPALSPLPVAPPVAPSRRAPDVTPQSRDPVPVVESKPTRPTVPPPGKPAPGTGSVTPPSVDDASDRRKRQLELKE